MIYYLAAGLILILLAEVTWCLSIIARQRRRILELEEELELAAFSAWLSAKPPDPADWWKEAE